MDHECHFHVNCWARLLDTHRYTDVYVTFVWCYSRLDFYACFKLTLPLSEFGMYSICEPERLAFIGCLSDLSRIHVVSPTEKGSVLKEML